MLSPKQQTLVPDLRGKTKQEALALLKQAHLRVGALAEGSSTLAKGLVCEQVPAAGVRVPWNAPVDLRLSRGPSDDPGVLKNGKEGASYSPPARGKSVIRLPRQVENPPTSFLKGGTKITLVAEGLENPRWLTVAENGDIFVVESRLEIKKQKQPNRVTVLRDTDGDGKADQRSVWADNLYLPFGIAFHRGFLYVANTGSVVRWPYKPGALVAPQPAETVISDIPETGMRQHWTRNLAFSPDGKWLYVTIGSKENADIEESPRASIVRYALDPTGKPIGKLAVFASGLRNPIGMAFHPKTGALWAVVSERDYLGDELVPDFLTEIKENGFYGWPYYYLGPHHDPRLPERPDLKKKTLVPDVLFPAHSAPLGLVFDRAGNAYVALHGSQNRSRFTGYKIVKIPAGRKKPQDFVTGWLVDPNHNAVNGRPAGLAWDRDGSLLIADDWAGRIWRVTGK
ncbi:DUF7133 domain-containing protein [Armatimonas rosea]|uniref:Glucose/arabinose dehydrogenase n=1 Tax=Armatimonas rosea TaxID=685828 RepID=A0A7W9STI3_ARMRO|nr:PQQ-dependent sugar dehydrogenase [Armatimonas rosea]MBB6052028.1 glucose/arabinose dehydrogenase [Armatimonas rosea]